MQSKRMPIKRIPYKKSEFRTIQRSMSNCSLIRRLFELLADSQMWSWHSFPDWDDKEELKMRAKIVLMSHKTMSYLNRNLWWNFRVGRSAKQYGRCGRRRQVQNFLLVQYSRQARKLWEAAVMNRWTIRNDLSGWRKGSPVFEMAIFEPVR